MKYENKLRDLPIRFWAKVEKFDDCWLWTGSHNDKGYGKFRLFGRSEKAHRVSYEMANGQIPSGMCVLHECDNTLCVRPNHLRLGTMADNSADRVAKKRAPSGELAPWSRLTRDQVHAIRADPRVQTKIAADYGICQQAVSDIKLRINWRDA